MINFNFGILNLLSKYIENKFTSHKQHLFCLLFSENPKKTHTDQSIPQVLLLCLKRNDSETLKSTATVKNLFSNVYVIDTMYFVR